MKQNTFFKKIGFIESNAIKLSEPVAIIYILCIIIYIDVDFT